MKFFTLFLAAVAIACCSVAHAELLKISNKAITVGVDTSLGGAITWLSDNNVGRNLINNHDEGREIQQSYYAPPRGYHGCKWPTNPWPWNPISAGDKDGHKSQILNQHVTGDSLSLLVRPLQWACDNVPCNCTFESTITFDPAVENAFLVKNTLRSFRHDAFVPELMDQETPAVYVNGQFSDLWTYQGDAPWTNAPLTKIKYPVPGPPWASFRNVSENWAAAAMPAGENGGQYAVGVYHQGIDLFLGGFHGTPSENSGSHDDATMYIAPITKKKLLHNTTWSWCFAVSVGYLDTVRETFNTLRQRGAGKC